MSKRAQVTLRHESAYDDAAPLVATFRNGPPPPNRRSDLGFEVFENRAKKQRLVVASADKVAYQGANFGYLGSAHDCASYAVGVFDKTTGEVRVMNVSQLYVLQQTVKGASDNVDDDRGADKSFSEQRRDLVEAFGSKKSKRMQRAREENLVQLDNISGAASVADTLQKKVDAAQKALVEARARDAGYSADGAALAATRNSLLPPIDIDAPTPDRVYNLRKVLDVHVMASLKMQAEQVVAALETTNVADYARSVGFTALPTRLLLSLPTPYDAHKVALIVYASYLLDFYGLHYPVRRSAAKLSEERDVPLVLMRHLLQLFSSAATDEQGHTTYMQPKTLKDKLVLYLLVVALTVNDFSLDLTEIASDLKRSPLSLGTYCRQLGCLVEKSKGDTAVYGGALSAKKQVLRAVLAVPLHFPAPKRGAGPRR